MKSQYSKIILIVLAGVALLVWSQVFYSSSGNNSDITINFLDVGQGDAILISLPGDEQILVDGGPGDAVLSQISGLMSPFDRKIEHIVLTHPHADHVAGLVKIIDRYEVGEVLENSISYDSAIYAQWKDTIKSKNIPDREVRQGDVFEWGGGRFEILAPVSSSSSVSGETNVNNASVVARFVYKNSQVMLTGDAEKEVLSSLCKLESSSLNSDVLKASHHGSENGFTDCFVSAVDPDVVVISVGRDNKYGHPHAKALEVYGKYVYEILRTDEEGTITCELDGEGVECGK